MLHLISKNVYTAEDWSIMEHAHAAASVKLGRSPFTDENANRLARTVMRLFDQRIRDANVIATMAAEEEAATIATAKKRDQ